MLRSLELLKTLPSTIRATIEPVIQRNAYWCHPEAVLLAMVADPDDAIRAKALQVIQRCREQSRGQVRQFVIPKLNFSATSYIEMFDWDDTLVTEPPLTVDISESSLMNILAAPLDVEHYPVHTQTVERTVRIVTEAASAVVGESARHGYICNRIKHRRQFPIIQSKNSFL